MNIQTQEPTYILIRCKRFERESCDGMKAIGKRKVNVVHHLMLGTKIPAPTFALVLDAGVSTLIGAECLAAFSNGRRCGDFYDYGCH